MADESHIIGRKVFLTQVPESTEQETLKEYLKNLSLDIERMYTGLVDNDTYTISKIPTIPEDATGAEINTGTDDSKHVTPKAIADSDLVFGTTGSAAGNILIIDSSGNLPAIGGDNLTGVMHLSGAETASGEKTFAVLPLSTTAAPAADGTLANKKYVDDSIGTVNSGVYTAFMTGTKIEWEHATIRASLTDAYSEVDGYSWVAPRTGEVTVVVQGKANTTNAGSLKAYKNGTGAGTELTVSTAESSQADNITVSSGDIISLYSHKNGVGSWVKATHIWIKCANPTGNDLNESPYYYWDDGSNFRTYMRAGLVTRVNVSLAAGVDVAAALPSADGTYANFQ